MRKRSRRCDPQKQRYWEEVVRRWKESGRSVREYCRAEGLRESAFFFWRRELSRRGPSSDTVSQAPSKGARVTPAPGPRKQPSTGFAGSRGPAPFLPVRVVESTAVEASRGLEIVLGQGRVVRVPAGFDRQTLAEVLSLLEVRPC
jgi:transposase-like protein